MSNQHMHYRERGAALIVALILLVVITLLGVSALRTSNLEIMMAGNMQFSQQAFQAAESAIETEISVGGFSTTLNRTDTYTYSSGATVDTTTMYAGEGEVPAGGYSLGSSFMAYHFETEANAEAARGATSLHRQGYYIVGPSAN